MFCGNTDNTLSMMLIRFIPEETRKAACSALKVVFFPSHEAQVLVQHLVRSKFYVVDSPSHDFIQDGG